jgi:hypothetical protein
MNKLKKNLGKDSSNGWKTINDKNLFDENTVRSSDRDLNPISQSDSSLFGVSKDQPVNLHSKIPIIRNPLNNDLNSSKRLKNSVKNISSPQNELKNKNKLKIKDSGKIKEKSCGLSKVGKFNINAHELNLNNNNNLKLCNNNEVNKNSNKMIINNENRRIGKNSDISEEEILDEKGSNPNLLIQEKINNYSNLIDFWSKVDGVDYNNSSSIQKMNDVWRLYAEILLMEEASYEDLVWISPLI